MSIAKTHENYSSDWNTPPEWWRWASQTLRAPTSRIFDPCPSNWTSNNPSGLEIQWKKRTYCNHPGSRGSAAKWWAKWIAERDRTWGNIRFVWCAFNVESLRHLEPSPFHLPGWLIWPRDRTAFVWGGPTMAATKKRSARIHGEPAKSPGNCAVWWCNVPPATPPVECVIVRTS